ncbi:hypothetical protein DFH09DRAFT_1461871 [Mycena vulgaris]|nr:hypothetical protein DFH09DRAFT_1461871 [Mycena vulgaris]
MELLDAASPQYTNLLCLHRGSSIFSGDVIPPLRLSAHLGVLLAGGEDGNALYATSSEGHTEIGGEYGNALCAASFGRYTEIVWELLERGADVNAQGGLYGNTMQAATYKGHTKIVQELLERGADVNTQGGRTATRCTLRPPEGTPRLLSASYSPRCDAFYARHARHVTAPLCSTLPGGCVIVTATDRPLCTSHFPPRSVDPTLCSAAAPLCTEPIPIPALGSIPTPPIQRCPLRRGPARRTSSSPNAALTPPSGLLPPTHAAPTSPLVECAPACPPSRYGARYTPVFDSRSLCASRYPSRSDPHPHIFNTTSIALVMIKPIRFMFLSE